MNQSDRCQEHHPESWWYGNKQCDKRTGHRGKHVYQTQTLYGPDPSEFTFWDAFGSTTFVNAKERKSFLRSIDEREAALDVAEQSDLPERRPVTPGSIA